MAGASVGVAIFDDRLEVWSWGRLPGGLTPEKLRIDHPSVRRNELIAEVFYRRGHIEKWGRGTQKIIIEKWGRGTQKIIELCRHAGLRDPDFLERGEEVGVRFWAAVRTVTAAEAGDLLPRQREVLDAVASLGMATVQEIRQRLQNPPGVRMMQQLLVALVESGRVTARVQLAPIGVDANARGDRRLTLFGRHGCEFRGTFLLVLAGDCRSR